MFNLGTRAFFVTSAVTFVFGLAYAFNSSDVGGFALLLCASFAAAFLGAVSLAATGTADRFALAGVQDLRSGRAPSSSAVPILVAAGLGVTALGTALGVAAYVGGLIVVAVGGVGWFMASWREHPDHVVALRPRVADRFSLPYGMPIAVTALIAVIAISISRILLSVSKNTATAVALALALVIFGGGFVVASRPKLDRKLLTGLVVVALGAVITLGIVGVSNGERKFGEHEKGATAPEKGATAPENGATAHTTETTAAK